MGYADIERDITKRKIKEEVLRASERAAAISTASGSGTRPEYSDWSEYLDAGTGGSVWFAAGATFMTQTAFENSVHPDDRSRSHQVG